MKKFGIIIGSVVVVGILLLALIPVFVDIDSKVRPLIIETVESNLDVKADLGKLSLNLFGGVNIGIENLKLTENKTKNILFELQNAKLQIPYLALLTGNISVTLNTDKPVIKIIRFKDGSLNISKLIKTQKTQEPAAAPSESGSAAAGAALSRLSFSTQISKAELQVTDQVTGFNFKVEDLDLKISNLGLNKDFNIELGSLLNINNKKDIVLNGPLVFNGTVHLKTNGAEFESVSLKSDLDLNKIEVVYANLLNKSKNVDFNILTNLTASKDAVKIDNFKLKAGDFEVLTQGTYLNATQMMDLSITSNDLDLSKWKSILAPLKDLDIAGLISLNMKASGSASSPSLNGSFVFKNGSAKVSGIQPRVENIQMTTDMKGKVVTLSNLSLKIGSSDFKANGTVEDFKKIKLNLNSQLLNVDEMLPQTQKKQADANQGGEAKDLGVILAAPLAAVRSNPTLKDLDVVIQSDIKKVIASNVQVDEIKAEITFKKLILSLKQASLKTFKGIAKANFSFDMNNVNPSYNLSADLNGIDMNEAIVSQFKELDKTLTGKANGSISINGVGLGQAQIRSSLKGQGQFNIKEGAWSGAVPLKKVRERLSKIPKVGEKLSKIDIDDRFKTFQLNFNIQSGKLNITKALIDSMQANTAIDATGVMDFDTNLKMNGKILTPITDFPAELKSKDGRANIPFELTGKAASPSVEWESTLQPIAKAYAKEEGKKLLNKGLEKVKEQAGEEVKKLFKNIKF